MGLIGRLSGRKISAGYDSPVNYNPTPVESESASRISAHLKGIDAVLSNSNASSIRETITQTSHGFSVGDVIRRNSSGSYVKAKANNRENSEMVGIVETVNSDEFSVVYSGRISGLSGLTDGSVYFLSPTTEGALTATEPTEVGQISKPILIATSSTSGIVVNFRGIEIEDTTPIEWGTIGGDLYSQTDLKNALDAAAAGSRLYLSANYRM